MSAAHSPSFGRRLFSLQLLRHVFTIALCVWALYIQTTYRIPGGFLFVLLPWLSAAVLGLTLVILINYVLNGAPADDPARRLARWIERAGGLLVRAFVYYSVFLFANGALDQTLPREHESEVIEIAGEEMDLGPVIPYTWANLRSWQTPEGTDRLLLLPWERQYLWAGQAVVVQVRAGYFGVPWVYQVLPDEGKHYTAVLRLAPGAKLARQALVRYYAQHKRWTEEADSIREYLALYPDDYEFAQHIGKALGGWGRYGDMLQAMEPFVTRQPSYEVYTLVGFAQGKVGRRAEAIDLLKRAIPLEPDNWWAYYFLGYVYGSTGNYAEAIASFEKVLGIRPVFPEVQGELGSLRTLLAAQNARKARVQGGSAPAAGGR